VPTLKPMSLYHLFSSELTLQEVLNLYKSYLPTAIALLYTPKNCQFATFTEGRLCVATEEISRDQLAQIFEARIFNQDYELRWLNQRQGQGKSVLLWDKEELEATKQNLKKQTPIIRTLDQTYALWGEGTGISPSEGWSRLAAARIGKLDVPIKQLSAKQRVYLKTREYLKQDERYGNVSVAEERLLSLNLEQGT